MTVSEKAHAILDKLPTLESSESHTIAEWLALSRAMHQEYRLHVPRMAQMTGSSAGTVDLHPGSADDARAALISAARCRALAELADPDHADGAWQLNGVTHQAFASHEELHSGLLDYYLAAL